MFKVSVFNCQLIKKMSPKILFRIYGEFCTSHPWEVIIATLTTIYMLTMEYQEPVPRTKPTSSDCARCLDEAEYYAVDVIVMTIIRSLAVLFSYYQFCNLYKSSSPYILAIASIFSVVSSFLFTSTVLNALKLDVSDLRDALFFFLLLNDMSKIGALAQFAMKGSTHEIRNNISHGISVLGPSITLDTIVEILVIGIGTLSGVHRLETFSYIACLSVLINYVVFMTIYPASLALILELLSNDGQKESISSTGTVLNVLGLEDKRNPIVESVKLIMSAGLVIVHTHSKLSYQDKDEMYPLKLLEGSEYNKGFNGSNINEHNIFLRWIVFSSDHIVILIILLALIAKYVLLETNVFVGKDSNDQFKKVQANNQTYGEIPKIKFYLDDQSEEEQLVVDRCVQTDDTLFKNKVEEVDYDLPTRGLDECLAIYRSQTGGSTLTDKEVIMLVQMKYIPAYQIEKAVDNADRAVRIRRQLFQTTGKIPHGLENLPFENYDYSKVMGACCENVIGYVPIPVGIVGPIMLDNRIIYVPLATTEGCLVASTNRGSRALSKLGITSRIVGDGMTRGPVTRFSSIVEASKCMEWIQVPDNFSLIKSGFDGSSRYARLTKIQPKLAGRYLFLRFVAKTGDAMGMNMLSKGTEISLKIIQNRFPGMEIISLSGNYCVDKKPAAINWIEGRGKSVVCEAIVPANTISSILKTSVHSLIDVNIAKNFIGSAMAGSIGGNNAHAANLVTAIFIATGQDPAQNVGSSNCITIMEPWGETGDDLHISCSMPSIEVGTVGGGTMLPAQAACLEMLGVQGSNEQSPGENANQLARIICATVLAGELSLMAALAAGHLVKSHLRHNRSSTSIFNNMNDNIEKLFFQTNSR